VGRASSDPSSEKRCSTYLGRWPNQDRPSKIEREVFHLITRVAGLGTFGPEAVHAGAAVHQTAKTARSQNLMAKIVDGLRELLFVPVIMSLIVVPIKIMFFLGTDKNYVNTMQLHILAQRPTRNHCFYNTYVTN
jgi:hypothetical protein